MNSVSGSPVVLPPDDSPGITMLETMEKKNEQWKRHDYELLHDRGRTTEMTDDNKRVVEMEERLLLGCDCVRLLLRLLQLRGPGRPAAERERGEQVRD